MKAHHGAPRYRDIEIEFTPSLHDSSHTLTCNYCGSITPEYALRLLQITGQRYSGSDWKYGWPHKFYLDPFKFYSEHLLDTPELIDEWNRIAAPLLGVEFFIGALVEGKLVPGDRLVNKAVRGIQCWGVGDERNASRGVY